MLLVGREKLGERYVVHDLDVVVGGPGAILGHEIAPFLDEIVEIPHWHVLVQLLGRAVAVVPESNERSGLAHGWSPLRVGGRTDSGQLSALYRHRKPWSNIFFTPKTLEFDSRFPFLYYRFNPAVARVFGWNLTATATIIPPTPPSDQNFCRRQHSLVLVMVRTEGGV